MGWRTLFTILINGVGRHIPSEWGQVTVQNVSDAMVIIHGTQTRACQNSCMSGHCVWDSLTTDARNKVTTYADLYKIDGYKSGPVLLRAVIACTHIDTRAASERFLRDLENLGAVMVQDPCNDKKPKTKKGNTGTVSVKPKVRFNAADTTIENVSDSD